MIACLTMSAASSGVMVGTDSYILVGAIMGVRTSGMLIVVKETPVSLNSEAAQREKASKAALDATYAENRGALDSTPIEEILITWPLRLFSITGRKPMISFSEPK